ncbi:MAG: hypothetical protein HYY59_00205 [Candidatus Omnitrophica bacterium]|nr:hypothetical protein [Candidatus Omnitrophota bacterium]
MPYVTKDHIGTSIRRKHRIKPSSLENRFQGSSSEGEPMIMRGPFNFSKQQELIFQTKVGSSHALIYRGDTTIRVFISTERKGDVDVFFSFEELQRVVSMLQAAILRSRTESRGFCGLLISNQLGDSDAIVKAIVHVLFVDKEIGVSIDMEGQAGTELWLDSLQVQQLIETLQSFYQP